MALSAISSAFFIYFLVFIPSVLPYRMKSRPVHEPVVPHIKEKKGKKKAIKTIKVTGNANAKIAKMPKKKGTYYIRISKLTKKTNGTYEIGYY